MNNQITITIAGKNLTGWTNFRLTRGLETMPSTFEVEFIGNANTQYNVSVPSGAPCTVMIGSDLVLTGYTGPISRTKSATSHTITLTGYSKCIDLIKCSAVLVASYHQQNTGILGNGFVQGTIDSIANQLCSPLNIQVLSKETQGNALTQPELINPGESVYAILERIARYVRAIIYDDPTGALVINDVGKKSHSSGFSMVQGSGNVSSATTTYDATDRMSDYYSIWQSFQGMKDTGVNPLHGYAQDSVVPRFRPLIMISEQVVNGVDLAQARADWECNRRIGRSQKINLEVSGPNAWRDSFGLLFQPNFIAPVHVPSLEISNQQWLIASVTYEFSAEGGTKLQTELMPASAFSPEPDLQSNPLAEFYTGKN